MKKTLGNEGFFSSRGRASFGVQADLRRDAEVRLLDGVRVGAGSEPPAHKKAPID
ncbi:hypothetical protein [Achromobacter sp. UMC71]|uniref:hypothetical protein n=1 Tax=Achromobacter sp. UMC71 TaxID=1862320 RepID=UPI001603020D|nr:hypothetical protein [Achromobacter sp. UMC71]